MHTLDIDNEIPLFVNVASHTERIFTCPEEKKGEINYIHTRELA